jgi:acyl-CoA thioesterase-1
MALATVVILLLVFSLAVFISANSETPKISASPNSNLIRVACVGDSLTAISGYPSDLQTMLGDNYSVGNFGVVGSTVSLDSWKPYMNQPEFQSALAFQPNIVIFLLGTNDDLNSLHQYNESFQTDYAKLISSFQQLDSSPDILIANSPPIFNDSADLSPAYLANTIIPLTDDLANSMNFPLIDLYSTFCNHADCFVDGVHLNSQGAAIIASEVYNKLDTAFNLAQIF